MKKVFACIYFWKVLNEKESVKRDIKLLYLWKNILFSHFLIFFLVIFFFGFISGGELSSPAPIIFIFVLAILHFIAQFSTGFSAVMKAGETASIIKREQRQNQPEITWKEAWEKDKKEMKKGIFLLDKGVLLFILAILGIGFAFYSIIQIASPDREYSLVFSLLQVLVGVALTIPFIRIMIVVEKEDEDTLEEMSNTYW